jgi:hypothetical protein
MQRGVAVLGLLLVLLLGTIYALHAILIELKLEDLSRRMNAHAHGESKADAAAGLLRAKQVMDALRAEIAAVEREQDRIEETQLRSAIRGERLV